MGTRTALGTFIALWLIQSVSLAVMFSRTNDPALGLAAASIAANLALAFVSGAAWERSWLHRGATSRERTGL
jgi:hypothetical protein